ncbi:MAG: VPLPA-CTERM sorting domain-containing protein [Sedimentitalea sp.]
MKTMALTAAMLLGFTGAVSAASISVDDFSTIQGPVTATGGATETDTQIAPGGALGDRTITVTNDAGSFGGTTGFITGPAINLFGVSNDFQTQGTVAVSYALGGYDLSDSGSNDTLIIGVESIDLAALFTIPIDGVSSSAGVSMLGTLNFSFADFVGVDFSDVSDLSFAVGSNGVNAVDSSFTFIGVDDLVPNVVAPIPLPAGGVLLLTGLLGLAYAKRRKA